MKFKFLFFIFYNTVSQTDIRKYREGYGDGNSLNKENYLQTEIDCAVYSCDPNNNYKYYEKEEYIALIHLRTGDICFIYPKKHPMIPMPFPLYQYDLQTDNPYYYLLNRIQRMVHYVTEPLNSNSDHQWQCYNQVGSYKSNNGLQVDSASTCSPNPQMNYYYQPISFIKTVSLSELCFKDSLYFYEDNPHIFFNPRFSIAQYCHYTSPNIVMNNLNPLQLHILKNIWDIFIKKRINELEPTLLDCLHKSRNNNKCWTLFDDEIGIFQKEENTEIFYHKPETLKDFCFYRRINNERNEDPRNEYLVLKGEPGPNFKNLRWMGDNVFIWDSKNIKENVTLYKYVFIGPGCRIENNSVILKDSMLYENVEIGPYTHIGFMTYLGFGCKIGVDIEKKDIQNCTNVVPTFKNPKYKFHDRGLVFKTFLNGITFIENNLIFQIGYKYDGYLIYYHMIYDQK